MQVLNFYSTVFADQLKRGRKTATIRLGDKSHKYRKNQVVLVTIGYQHSPREKIFQAVIDQVEVKRVKDLSPRDIEHDNPEFRRTEEMVHFLEQIYGQVGGPGGHGHRRALLADHRAPQRRHRAPARLRRRPELAGGAHERVEPQCPARTRRDGAARLRRADRRGARHRPHGGRGGGRRRLRARPDRQVARLPRARRRAAHRHHQRSEPRRRGQGGRDRRRAGADGRRRLRARAHGLRDRRCAAGRRTRSASPR